jgi:alpha-L-fucosidase
MADDSLLYRERMKWFQEARFGMFIHWGLYALLGRGEWTMFQDRIPVAEYRRLAKRFKALHFDADAWARTAAEAGMRYMVLTARHHDGFCLFDSQVSDFTAPKTAAKRDFVAEYVAACRKAGLKVGIYYSPLSWQFPGNFEPEKHPASVKAMVELARAQVKELMSGYGKIDLLWYDGGYVYNAMKSRADMAPFWGAQELNAEVRRLQPGIIINNRIGLDEDIDTPEQHVKASDAGRAWESCMTMAGAWGYVKHYAPMMTAAQVLNHLVTAASGEGNFLLNVGPKPDGTLRKEETDRLSAIGRWMKVNGEAIYGSQRCALSGGSAGMWTCKGTVGYLHVVRWTGRTAEAPMVKSRAQSAELLGSGAALKVEHGRNGRLLISGLPAKPPSPLLNVIKVRFSEVPERLPEPDRAAFLKGKL